MLLGGSARAAQAIPIELCAAALLAVVILRPLPAVRGRNAALAFIVALVLLIAAQLLPLPIDWWRALPGRDLAHSILVVANAVPDTHPISLDAEATLSLGMCAIVPIALFLATLQSSAREREVLVLAFVVLGSASALLGVAQVAASSGYLYASAHEGTSTGFFANRNHHADLVQTTMLMLVGWACMREADRRVRLAMLGVVFLFALLTIITTSRAGVGLLALSVPVSVALLFSDRRIGWRALLPLVLVSGGGLALVLTSDALAPIFARFEGATDDVRSLFWRESLVAIDRFWPVGSGLGTFVPVYATIEDLQRIDAFVVNHAHNDYLEIALEAGLVGVALIVAFFALLVERALRIRRAPDASLRAAALASIVVVLLHSAVDYPLRTFTMLAPFAVMLGFLYSTGLGRGTGPEGDRS